MNGFIYIMSNPIFSDGRIKIGKSKSDPSSFRKDELYSTGVPEPFQVEYFAFVENYDSVELQVHERLDDKRPNKEREFFTSTITEAINTIREISNIKYEEDLSDSSLLSEKVKEEFYSDGQTLYQRSYQVIGPGHGFEEWFWYNGQLQERTNYKNGELHGVSERFDFFGNKIKTKTYKNGELHGPQENYYAADCDQTHKLNKDQLKGRGNFKTGVIDGLWEYFHENGQLKVRGNYKQCPPRIKLNQINNRLEGEKDGLWEQFYEDSKLKIKANFKDGKHDGLYEEFDEDGNLTKTETYRNGELVETNENP